MKFGFTEEPGIQRQEAEGLPETGLAVRREEREMPSKIIGSHGMVDAKRRVTLEAVKSLS
jgi:hypothetical protein